MAGLGLALLAAVTAALAAGLAAAEEKTDAKEVGIGMPITFFRDLEPAEAKTLMSPFKNLMEKKTGLTGDVVITPGSDSLSKQLSAGQLQLGVFHGFEFAWARLKNPHLKPLVIAINQQRTLKAYLVVARDSKVAGLTGLQDKTLALPRALREHCMLFLERHCRDCGLQPARFFGKMDTVADAEDALDAVVNGDADATVMDGVSLEWYQRRRADHFAHLKVVLESEVFPATVVAYNEGSVPQATIKCFRDGMIRANQDRAGQLVLAMCRMTGFEPIPEDYERLLTDILKAYPPPEDPR
jgi:ABC-type phosphate/phosphonate transport system substrate-binding protein